MSGRNMRKIKNSRKLLSDSAYVIQEPGCGWKHLYLGNKVKHTVSLKINNKNFIVSYNIKDKVNSLRYAIYSYSNIKSALINYNSILRIIKTMKVSHVNTRDY